MLSVEKLMGGAVSVVLHHQTKAMSKTSFRKRLVPLENNECIKPLLNDVEDPVRADIEDIPRICSGIQDEWNDASLNRLEYHCNVSSAAFYMCTHIVRM